ncbi:MAG: aminotransferase class IV, partial [SAR324 cluster bacterium]|nr:aminotransferase class IV [SAR324 cluster bacterium]
VCTPARGVLEGITRMTVLELCAECDLPLQLGEVPAQAVRSADEVFLSSTAGGVLPVTKVDGKALGTGEPGPVTNRLRDLYWSKKEAGWHGTPVQ